VKNIDGGKEAASKYSSGVAKLKKEDKQHAGLKEKAA